MFIDQFHFLRPWWLALVLLWLPLLVWRMRATQGGAALARLADADLLPYLLVGRRRSRWSGWLLACLAAMLVTLALAGPTWQRVPQPLYTDGAARVVVVSLSRRMLAQDVKPDRLQRVRFKVHDLLHANASGRNGLVAYAGAAFTVAPLTTDAHALDDLVDALAPAVMPVAGDAPARGIARGAALLRHAGVQGGSLVVVTDTVDAAAIAAARHAHAQGIRVSVLGVGTTKGSPVELADGNLLTDPSGNVVMARRDDASLRALAAAGGGVYVPMRADHADIEALAAQLHDSHRASAPMSARGARWRDMGPWLLLPLLLLAALSFRRGWLLVLAVVLAPCVTPPAHATGVQPAAAGSVARPGPAVPDPAAPAWRARWSALWHNADQRAARALADGHPRRALAMAHSPAWRGAAAYRAGDYAAAAQAYAQAPGAEAAYNLGNALARQGRYRAAIKAYDKALQQDPKDSDARANRAAVRNWLRKHQPPPGANRTGARPNQSQGKRGPHPPQRKGAGQGSAQASSAPPSAASSAQPAEAASGQAPARAASTQAAARPAPASSGAGARSAPPTHGKAARTDAAPDTQPGQGGAGQPSRVLPRQAPAASTTTPPTFNLGQVPAHSGSSAPLPQTMQRALERVPDDPGGLLRRKFQLEYQERQSGHARGDGGQW